VRGESLEASMSQYLISEIAAVANIDVRLRARVVGGEGEARLERLVLRDDQTGSQTTHAASGLFVLIGARPHTDWLPAVVARDRWGFVLTGHEAEAAAGDERCELETTVPGLFAVGDVRAGSTKRAASAVGEGSVVISQVHGRLSHHPAPVLAPTG
jgi:thioredoxin reductase (NADPH)